MDIREQNRQLALTVLADFCARRIDAATARMSEAFTWTLMRRCEGAVASNQYVRSDLADLAKISESTMPEGLTMTVTGSAADLDRVAIEAESNGRFIDGRIYSNVYHFLFEIQDGQVSAIREYMDTAYAAEMFEAR